MDGSDGSNQVAVALRLASFQLAKDIFFAEPAGLSRDRMKRALEALERSLREEAGEFYVRGATPDLTAMLDGTSLNDRHAFLLEVITAQPFAPYWFEWTKLRRGEHREAIRRLAGNSLAMEVEDAERIEETWRRLQRDEAKAARARRGLSDYALWGLAAAAVAGVAVMAGPVIAVLMPAAANLSGAAAISAGMAQLGFGSIAAGGLGMTGGMWMLGVAGGVVGLGSAAGIQTALHEAVGTPGAGELLRIELVKLLASATLAKQFGWFGGDLEPFEAAIDQSDTEVDEQLAVEQSRNDPKAPRLEELATLRQSLDFAREQLRGLTA